MHTQISFIKVRIRFVHSFVSFSRQLDRLRRCQGYIVGAIWWFATISVHRSLALINGLSFKWTIGQISWQFLCSNFLLKSPSNIAPLLYFAYFTTCISINKFLSRNVTTTHSDEHLTTFFDFDIDLLLAKLVDAFGLTQE